MRDIFGMHCLKTYEYLPHVLLYQGHLDWSFGFIGILEHLFQASVAEFHDCVLDYPVSAVDGVEEVVKLDYVGFVFQHSQYLILP